jgi:hypothetical protein
MNPALTDKHTQYLPLHDTGAVKCSMGAPQTEASPTGYLIKYLELVDDCFTTNTISGEDSGTIEVSESRWSKLVRQDLDHNQYEILHSCLQLEVIFHMNQ